MMHPFDEYDQELVAKAQKEIVAENAAWAALPQTEKTRILAEREKLKSCLRVWM
jgi:hypothetical protein